MAVPVRSKARGVTAVLSVMLRGPVAAKLHRKQKKFLIIVA